MPRIAPSILSADFACLGKEVERMERAGADWLHVDVMDGHFVPNLTVGPVVVRWLKKRTRLDMDVHLMIEAPEKFIPAFAEAGAWNITVHGEACADPRRTLRLIKKCGCRAGLSLRPRTPIQKIAPYLGAVDTVLVMTVEPGFGGQRFMPEMLPKVSWLREYQRRSGKKFWIEVDGGINTQTAPRVVQAGATVLVAGTAIFGQPDPKRALHQLRRAASSPVL
ncbi:MAG TPA: ribulose-phosphate 3-epimerase [Elusimicrobiota bacterium]|nr:ribulose-phosphate 3-epimerase [Elusimicrobiota bacterium]